MRIGKTGANLITSFSDRRVIGSRLASPNQAEIVVLNDLLFTPFLATNLKYWLSIDKIVV